MLEVIALDAADAEAAEEGGADRLEIVADMSADGLTPAARTVAEIRRATRLPLRVMLRANGGFSTYPAELRRLRTAAAALADAGADGFVLGFVDGTGGLDTAAMRALVSAVPGLPWTCHRAIDQVADPDSAWRELADLPGLDAVLTAGSPGGVGTGIDVLRRRAAADPHRLMAGGGLRPGHVPTLAASGVRAFHVGSLARRDGAWTSPVSPTAVRRWRHLVDR